VIGSVYYLESDVDPRNVLGLVGAPRVPTARTWWRVLCRGKPFDRGPRRNVLVERVVPYRRFEMGARRLHYRRHPSRALMVRPFRGMRRAEQPARR
jgi:hypothetical protein